MEKKNIIIRDTMKAMIISRKSLEENNALIEMFEALK